MSQKTGKIAGRGIYLLILSALASGCVVDSSFLEGKPCGEGDVCAKGYTCVRTDCGGGFLCPVCLRNPDLTDGGSDGGLDGQDGSSDAGDQSGDEPVGCQADPPSCRSLPDCQVTEAQCQDDAWVCPGEFEAIERSCDGLDNDCDGLTDSALICSLAGAGEPGWQDGSASEARFDHPRGLLGLPTGDLLVADQGNHVLRLVSADGSTSTWAGDGQAGHLDGPRATAKFREPSNLAWESSGAVLVADSGNHRIRRIDSAGQVSTLAGSGFVDYQDGPAEEARFAFPAGVAVDNGGTIFVADSGNHCIRRIQEGQVSTFAGRCETPGVADGDAQSARFNSPTDVLVLIDGSLLVAEESSHRIRWIAPDGTVSTLAGTGEYGYLDGELDQAQFRNPRAMISDSTGGVVLIADSGNHRIRSLSTTVTTLLGSGLLGSGDGPADLVELNHPSGLAYLGDGRLVIADTNNHMLRVQNP